MSSFPCTIVTAFYAIRSKFPKEQYLEWGRHFMSLSAPIVIFTEGPFVETLKEMRGDRPIHIVILPFDKLKTWSGDMMIQWVAQHTLNPEGELYSESATHRAQQTPELYALWANKTNFVNSAIQLDPFHSEVFFWCDFGAFREPPLPEIRERFPERKWFPSKQMIFQAMTPIPLEEKEGGPDGIIGPRVNHSWNHVRLIGGLWGGEKEACIEWAKAYETMLYRYLKEYRYAGNDQIVMLSTLLENPKLGIALKPTRSDINQWFFLEYVLSSLAEYKVDLSYL